MRLSAADHAACTRLVVTNPKAGQVLRVRLEYRQVEGKRPQICVWQVGVEGCDRAPRAQLNGQWTPYEQFVTVDDEAKQIQLILHADVGERLQPRTVTDYRNITIEALADHDHHRLPAGGGRHHGESGCGSHTLAVTGGPSGSILDQFEPLQDCFPL